MERTVTTIDGGAHVSAFSIEDGARRIAGGGLTECERTAMMDMICDTLLECLGLDGDAAVERSPDVSAAIWTALDEYHRPL